MPQKLFRPKKTLILSRYELVVDDFGTLMYRPVGDEGLATEVREACLDFLAN
jgi:hypothetical protein